MTQRDWLEMGLVAIMSSCTPETSPTSSEPISNKSESHQEPHPSALGLISKETNQFVLEKVLEMFHPSVRPYLTTIPIVKNYLVRTAAARTSRQLSSSQKSIGILVSPDWDNKAKDSMYWDAYFSKPNYNMKPDDPVFSTSFKIELLAHEYLHLIMDHLYVNPSPFFKQVAIWYHDENFGRPGPDEVYMRKKTKTNRMKYMLWWNLYGQAGNPNDQHNVEWQRMDYHGDYVGSISGEEEFAYLGGNIAIEPEEWRRKDRLAELPSEIVAAYQGILNPALLE